MPDQLVVLRPNATVSTGNWIRSGGITAHGVLADDDDLTYMQSPGLDATALELEFGTFALPDRAQIRRIRPSVRASTVTDADGFARLAARLLVGTLAHPDLDRVDIYASEGILTRDFGARYYDPSGGPWDQADLDAIRLRIARSNSTDADRIRVREAYLRVAYNLAPVVGVFEPSAPVTTTSRPTVRFQFSDQDNDPIERYHCYVYPESVYSAPDFVVPPPDPETNVGGARKPPGWVFAVGPVYAQGEHGLSLHDVTITEPLTNGRYRAYVFVSDVGSKARYSAGDFIEWLQDVPAPGLPTLTAEVE
jgi:hypothetical protein